MQQQLIYWNAFIKYIFARFQSDKCSSVAAELTVTTLLALVPLTTVLFSLLAFMPDFQTLALQLQETMFEYFVPSTGHSVNQYLIEFVGKAKSISGLGFVMLMVTALLMMKMIDKSINHIWQIKTKKSRLRTFLVYWSILTLGPILVGTSLLLTSYLKSFTLVSNVVQQNSLWLSIFLPFVMALAAFTLIFYVIPNRKIKFTHAVIGALISSILFELAKSLFGIFVEYFSTYQIVFGALATLPLFLIWIYLSWSIILFGVEICHGLFSFEMNSSNKQTHLFVQLTKILLLLSEKQLKGQSLSEQELHKYRDLGNSEAKIILLDKLVETGLVAQLNDQSYCLRVNRDEIEFKLIYQASGRLLPSNELILRSDISEGVKNKMSKIITNFESSLKQKLLDN